MQSHSFVDLFAGCGGLSLGLSLSGMRGRFAIERDPMAFATFSANFLTGREVPIKGFDWPSWLEARAWAIDELLETHKLELEKLRGSIDVLAGGPPCQGFSFAGRRAEDDPRNLLFEKYVEAVDAIRPSALVLENVPGMRVGHARHNVLDFPFGPAKPSRGPSFYDKLAASLDKIGYDVEAVLVDASRFGVPQRRSRLIAIGVKRDLARWLDGGIKRVFDLLEHHRGAQLAELGLTGPVTAPDAISDLEHGVLGLEPCTDRESSSGFQEARYQGPATPYQHLMHEGYAGPMDSMRLARHRDEIRERFARIIAECAQGVRMNDESRKEFGLKKHRIFPMSREQPAPTITTLPDDILHYSEPRILTVRECARLQSFPDWFAFRGKFTTGGNRRTRECPRYTQVGNAVPPYLARAIGLAVRSMLDEVALARDAFDAEASVQPVAVTA
jgi:DNA (cytosine-5)-methyltransferase 1